MVCPSISRNALNLKDGYAAPLSGDYTYLYDKDRRLTSIYFPSGRQITNVYANGQLDQIQTPEATIDLDYFCGGKVSTITTTTQSLSCAYDGPYLSGKTWSGTLNTSIGSTYNDDFVVDSVTYAGETETLQYDNDGLLTQSGDFTLTNDANTGLTESIGDTAWTIDPDYNGYAEVEALDYFASGTRKYGWYVERYNTGPISARTEYVAGATLDYDYTYDGFGRLTEVWRNSQRVEYYEYDQAGRRSYEENALRGISSRSYDYSSEDHLLFAGGFAYTYDLDGFLVSKTDGTETTTYDYSSRGELLSVTLPDNTLIEHDHDPLGQRIAKRVNGVVTEKYLWSGLTGLLAVYDGSDNLLMRFEYAGGRMPVAMTKNSTRYYLAYDQVGSLRAVVDASGAVVKRMDYDSFGNILADTNSSFEVPFGFAGGLHDRDTGLVRFGYRDYDPDTGRWTAKDPIGFADGTDIYEYCVSSPVSLSDSTGLYSYDDFLWDASNFSAGMGDFISLGTTGIIRDWWMGGDIVDRGSGMYNIGTAAGMAATVAITAGGGAAVGGARTGTLFGSRSFLFGTTRGAGARGLLNGRIPGLGTAVRVGWSYHPGYGRAIFSVHGGVVGTASSYHVPAGILYWGGQAVRKISN